MSAHLTQNDARVYALTLPETHEDRHRGRPDLRVQQKIFATLPPDGSVNLKTTPVDLDLLVSTAPETYRDVWDGKWVGVDLGRAARSDVQRLLVKAWRLAAPKRLSNAHPQLGAAVAEE